MKVRGTLKNGEIAYKNPQKVRDVFRKHDGKTVIISLPDKPKRSLSQNNFYWFYLGVIEAETGNTADDLHELFKRKLLPPQFKTIMGEQIRLPSSTTELSKADFGDYMDKICALTGVPIPNPSDMGYISN